jgi:hypothetical protein
VSYREFWGAVVEQAAIDLLHPEMVGATAADRASAFEWVRDASRAPAGFLWACEASGIDPALVTDRLKARGWM